MGIRTKLLAGFLLVALFTGALGLHSAVSGSRLKGSSQAMYSDAYTGTYLLASWLNEVRHSEGELTAYLVLEDRVGRDEIRAEIADFDARLATISAQLTTLDGADGDSENPQPLLTSWDLFVNWRNASVLGAFDAGDLAGARDEYRRSGDSYAQAIDVAATTYLEAKRQRAIDLHMALEVGGQQSGGVSLAIASGATLAALIIGLFLSRTISAAASEVAAAAIGLARGDLDQRVEIHSRDELGIMAGAVREAIAYQQEMARLATSVAAGDLSQEVLVKGPKDVLGVAFQRMTANLRSLLGELHERTAELASVTDSMSDGLVVLGPDHLVKYANAPALALFNATPDEVIGIEAQQAFASLRQRVVEPEKLRKLLKAASGRLKDPPSYEMRVLGPPRRTVKLQLFAIGDTRSVGILLHDISPERELLQAKDELVSIVSHELASPATNLVAYAELLATGTYPPRERSKMLGTLVQEGQRLTAIIQDFLDIRRIEHGGFQLTPRPANVTTLLRHAARIAVADADHPFTFALPANLPLVQIDPNRVQQVLANLLSNARKYCPAGGRISLSARQLEDAVEISVADEGLGIPLAAQAHLFDKFYRVDSEDRREIKGTGLGLAIVKEIVEALGGHIHVESAGAGHGSRFWFTLPLAGQPATVSRRVAIGRRRVLVVEDSEAIRNSVRRVLRRDGHHLQLVQSAEEALALLAVQPFDVVMTDLVLGPGRDGWELIGTIHRAWPAVRIVLSSGQSEIEGAEARERGASTVLCKPYQPEDLRRAIGEWDVEPADRAA